MWGGKWEKQKKLRTSQVAGSSEKWGMGEWEPWMHSKPLDGWTEGRARVAGRGKGVAHYRCMCMCRCEDRWMERIWMGCRGGNR